MSSISSTNNMNYGMMQQVQGHGRGGQPPKMPSADEIADSFFSKLDTSNQGYIDQTQLTNAMGEGSDDASSKLFSALDSDRDGQLTKTELTTSLEKQFANAGAQFQTRMAIQNSTSGAPNGQMPPPPPGGGMGGMMPPPPKPSASEEDTGLTEAALTTLAEETDGDMASHFRNIAANFDAADADGKVTRSEAMAYEKSQQSSASTTTSSTSNDNRSLKFQFGEMMRLYNITASNDTTSSGFKLSA